MALVLIETFTAMGDSLGTYDVIKGLVRVFYMALTVVTLEKNVTSSEIKRKVKLNKT